MEEKVNAIYIMVRQEELKPEDGGSYDVPLARQKQECLEFLRSRVGEPEEPVEVYTRRGQLLKDIERQRIKRLVVLSPDRLGSNREEIDAILFELTMAGIELLTVRG
jgi:DNA invertase Pin-like site-specific DNA recombinase